jgi:uncharacterized protein YbcI
MREPPATSAPREDRGQMLLDISNVVVRIHKQFYGKGPTKARSTLSHDLLVVLLEGGFTRSEETLLAHGHTHEVAQARHAMQASVESEMRTAVEQIVHRKVRSFMSANDPDEAMQVEIFVLSPDEVAPMREEELHERAQRAREQHREVLDEHRALRAEQAQIRRRSSSGGRVFEP